MRNELKISMETKLFEDFNHCNFSGSPEINNFEVCACDIIEKVMNFLAGNEL